MFYKSSLYSVTNSVPLIELYLVLEEPSPYALLEHLIAMSYPTE